MAEFITIPLPAAMAMLKTAYKRAEIGELRRGDRVCYGGNRRVFGTVLKTQISSSGRVEKVRVKWDNPDLADIVVGPHSNVLRSWELEPIQPEMKFTAADLYVYEKFERGDRVVMVGDQSVAGTIVRVEKDRGVALIKWDDGTVQKHWYWSITPEQKSLLAAAKYRFQRGDRVTNLDRSISGRVLKCTQFMTVVHWERPVSDIPTGVEGKGRPDWNSNVPTVMLLPERGASTQIPMNFTAAYVYELEQGTRVWSQTRGPRYLGTVERVKKIKPPDGVPRQNEQAMVTVKWDDGGKTEHPEWEIGLAQKKLFTAARDSRAQAGELKRGDRVNYIGNPDVLGTVVKVIDLSNPKLSDEFHRGKVIVKWDDPTYTHNEVHDWELEPVQPQMAFTAAVNKHERALREQFKPGAEVTWYNSDPQHYLGVVHGAGAYAEPYLEVFVDWLVQNGKKNPSPSMLLARINSSHLRLIEPQHEMFAAVSKDVREIKQKFPVGSRVRINNEYLRPDLGLDGKEGTVNGYREPQLDLQAWIDPLKVLVELDGPVGPVDGIRNWEIFPRYLEPIAPQHEMFASRGVVKTAISLPDLVRQTNAFSKKYRGGCSPSLMDSNPKALFLHYNVKCQKEDSDPAGHDVRVQFDVTKVQESQQAKDLDIQVQCSCPAFLYWGAQWNLHQRDGLLGPSRPKLQAPTERLDLRGNYVICKHIHAVFERILPSVQHNIVKILREREMERKKDELDKTPERLQEKQEEMKKKKELEKIRKTKDKEIQEKMLEALKQEEEARLLHEQELENQGGAPEEGEVKRDHPATEPAALPKEAPAEPAPAPEEQELADIEDLTGQEEEKIEQLHEEGKPHVHKGLPYDVEETPKGKGWVGERVSSWMKFKPGDKVVVWRDEARTKTYGVGIVEETHLDASEFRRHAEGVAYTVRFIEPLPEDGGIQCTVPESQIDHPQLNIFAAAAKFKVGDKVRHASPRRTAPGVVELAYRTDRKKWAYGVRWEGPLNPAGVLEYIWENEIRPAQHVLFSAAFKFQVGDRVKYWSQNTAYTTGTVQERLRSQLTQPEYVVRWDGFDHAPTGDTLAPFTEKMLESQIRHELEQQPMVWSGAPLQASAMSFKPGDKVYLYGDTGYGGTVTRVHKDIGAYSVKWDDPGIMSEFFREGPGLFSESQLEPGQRPMFEEVAE